RQLACAWDLLSTITSASDEYALRIQISFRLSQAARHGAGRGRGAPPEQERVPDGEARLSEPRRRVEGPHAGRTSLSPIVVRRSFGLRSAHQRISSPDGHARKT